MTPNQINILARLIEALRPDWGFHGIRAALNGLPLMDRFDVAQLAITAAADSTAETPAAMRNPIYNPGTTKPEPTRDRSRDAALLAELRERKPDPEAARRGREAALAALRANKTNPQE